MIVFSVASENYKKIVIKEKKDVGALSAAPFLYLVNVLNKMLLLLIPSLEQFHESPKIRRFLLSFCC